MARRDRHTRPCDIRGVERRMEALRLRRSGLGYREIGKALGVSLGRAHQYVTGLLDETRKRAATDAGALRQIELDRLDAMQAAVWPEAEKGNCRAIDTVLRIMGHRAQLLGLDTPEPPAPEALPVFRINFSAIGEDRRERVNGSGGPVEELGNGNS